MRDVQRIEAITRRLASMWYKYPEMRFCQMLAYILPRDRDCFYLEDEEFLNLLDEKLKEW